MDGPESGDTCNMFVPKTVTTTFSSHDSIDLVLLYLLKTHTFISQSSLFQAI